MKKRYWGDEKKKKITAHVGTSSTCKRKVGAPKQSRTLFDLNVFRQKCRYSSQQVGAHIKMYLQRPNVMLFFVLCEHESSQKNPVDYYTRSRALEFLKFRDKFPISTFERWNIGAHKHTLNIPVIIILYSIVYLETERIKCIHCPTRARVRGARVPPDHVEFVTLVLQTHTIIIIIITWGKSEYTAAKEKKNYYNNDDNNTYRWAIVDVVRCKERRTVIWLRRCCAIVIVKNHVERRREIRSRGGS